jgi:hypothetical protein
VPHGVKTNNVKAGSAKGLCDGLEAPGMIAKPVHQQYNARWFFAGPTPSKKFPTTNRLDPRF